MRITTLKDYAREQNVSYEAIRKQIKRYSKELSGHIIRDGRQQMLDEVAVEFLNDKRQKNPVVIVQQDKDALITTLQAENKELLLEITRLQRDIINTASEQKFLEASKEQAEKQAIELRQKNVELEVALSKSEADNKTLSDVVEINAQEAEQAKKEAEALRSELQRLKNRGFFARLFNRE